MAIDPIFSPCVVVHTMQNCFLTCSVTTHPDCRLQYAASWTHIYLVPWLAFGQTATVLRFGVAVEWVRVLAGRVPTRTICNANIQWSEDWYAGADDSEADLGR